MDNFTPPNSLIGALTDALLACYIPASADEGGSAAQRMSHEISASCAAMFAPAALEIVAR